jgi:hypothetical protein
MYQVPQPQLEGACKPTMHMVVLGSWFFVSMLDQLVS